MSLQELKLLAVYLMVVDHLGVYLFPDNIFLRSIGRLSFPIFAWFFVEGYRHTRNWKRYFMRLLSVAVVAQSIIFVGGGIHLNILFLFAYTLLLLKVLEEVPEFLRPSLIVAGILVPQLLQFDYGSYGVALILIFSYLQDLQKRGEYLLWLCCWLFVNLASAFIVAPIQPLAALALVPIRLVQSESLKARPSKLNRLFFYAFYPAHLAVLVGIKLFLRGHYA